MSQPALDRTGNSFETAGRHPPGEQLRFLFHELCLQTGGKPERWLVIFFESAGVVLSYRLDRFGYLIFGKPWRAVRIVFWPVFLFFRLLSCRHEICYKAEIGCGLCIRHPTLGVVVHGEAIIGKNCLLLGGNSIGERRPLKRGELVLGDDVQLGINACVLGPARVGNSVVIGAGAIVVGDLPDNAVAVGVPARFKLK
jgi:serine O-acetyltransferase